MARHRVFRRRPGKAGWLLALGAVVGVLTLFAGAAGAYWSSGGTGSGSATTGTLNPPTSVAGSQTPGTGTVNVSWTASTGTPSPTGYYVTRTDMSNSTVSACGTSATSPTASTSCADQSVPLGTYTYRVIAIYRSWTSTSAPSAAVTVSKSSQAITFTSTPPASAAVGGSYTVTATGGGSGNPVTFTSATTSICTVNAATVTFAHAGTCTINADQAGSTYYSAAPTAQQTFSIGKASQTITFTSTAPANATAGGATYTVAASGGASGNSVIFMIDAATTANCSISGSTVSFLHAGTCTIDANQAGNADYLAATQAQQSFAVSGAPVSISSVAPSGLAGRGTITTVTVSGSGFQSGIQVSLNDTNYVVKSITYNSSIKITITIQNNYANNGTHAATLTVTNPDGGTASKSSAVTNTG